MEDSISDLSPTITPENGTKRDEPMVESEANDPVQEKTAQDPIILAFDDDGDKEEEYSVERLVNRRRNPKTGNLEYEVKWLDYDSSDNTWEPVENLSCPDLIAEFNLKWEEKQKKKYTKKNKKQLNNDPQASTSKQPKEKKIRPKRKTLIVEDGSGSNDGSEEETFPNQKTDYAEPVKHGFEKGLKLSEIIASATSDQHDLKEEHNLYFFVKWDGEEGVEMIEYTELVKHEPRMLCDWYRKRLYHDYESLLETDFATL